MYLYSGNRRTWIGQAGRRVWIFTLIAASAFLFFAYPPLSVEAKETPGVEAGDGTVRVGDDVFAGDGCARAGDVVAGECGEDSGADQSKDGPDNETPGKTDGQSGNDGESSTLEETTMGETDRELTGGTTTGPETTSFEGSSSTNGKNSEGNACPAAPPEDAQPATVERAVDGDTLELKKPVDGYDRVRLIGVDTPELNKGEGEPKPYAEKAARFTAEALEGKDVLLEIGQDKEDPYARLLAYVWIEPKSGEPELFNETLLSEGHARLMTVEPNDAYAGCFAGFEEKAREDNRGIWSDEGAKDESREGLLGRIQDLLSSNGEPAGSENQYTEAETTALTQPNFGGLKAGGSTMKTSSETTSERLGETTTETASETPEEITSEAPAETSARTATETTGAAAGLADVPPEDCPGATTAFEPFNGTEKAQSPHFETTGGAFVVRTDLQGEDPSAVHLDVSILDTVAPEPVEQFDQRTEGSYDTRISREPGSYLLDLKSQAGSFEVVVFDCANETAVPAETGSHEPTVAEPQGEENPGARMEMNSPAPVAPQPDETSRDPEGRLPADTLAHPAANLPTHNTPSGEVPVLPDTGGHPPGLMVFVAVLIVVTVLATWWALRNGLAGRFGGNSRDPR